MMVNSSGVLTKRGNRLLYLPSDAQNSTENVLMKIEMSPEHCTLTPSSRSKAWISAGYFEEAGQHGIEVKENSTFRLDHDLLCVNAAIRANEVSDVPYVPNNNPDQFCRYCYELDDNEDNPLFLPCKCTDYIHLNCFLNFIKKKFDWDYWRVGRQQWRAAQCEICHGELPLVFKHQGRNYFFCTDPDFAPPLLMMTHVDLVSTMPYCFLFKNKRKVDLFGNDTSLEYRNDKFYLRCSNKESPVYLEAPDIIRMEQDMCLQIEEFQLTMMLRHTIKIEVLVPQFIKMVEMSNVEPECIDFPPD